MTQQPPRRFPKRADQATPSFKQASRAGVLGIGLTENILAYGNTSDIGLHLSWAYLLK